MLPCRPFWLLRELTVVIITAVYIPPQSNTDQALKELYGNISEQETANPDAEFIVTGTLTLRGRLYRRRYQLVFFKTSVKDIKNTPSILVVQISVIHQLKL